MISFLQNKRLNQFMILLLCLFPIVVAAQGIEEALLNTKNNGCLLYTSDAADE